MGNLNLPRDNNAPGIGVSGPVRQPWAPQGGGLSPVGGPKIQGSNNQGPGGGGGQSIYDGPFNSDQPFLPAPGGSMPDLPGGFGTWGPTKPEPVIPGPKPQPEAPMFASAGGSLPPVFPPAPGAGVRQNPRSSAERPAPPNPPGAGIPGAGADFRSARPNLAGQPGPGRRVRTNFQRF